MDESSSAEVVIHWHADLDRLLGRVNGLYYQAHNLVVTRPVYSDELARIEQRRNFFRGLGFLSELFFLLYGLWATIYPIPREWYWDLSLALLTGLFVYILNLSELERFTWDLTLACKTFLPAFAAILLSRLILCVSLMQWPTKLWKALGWILRRFPRLRSALLPHSDRLKIGEQPVAPIHDPAFELYRIGTHMREFEDGVRRIRSYLQSSARSDKGLNELRNDLNEGRALLVTLSRKTLRLQRLLQYLYGADKDQKYSVNQRHRSSSIARFAILSAAVLGVCTIGSHAESIEYNLQVFGYYIVELTHGHTTETHEE